MLPFSVNIQATVPQRSEIPEGLMNYSVLHSRNLKLLIIELLMKPEHDVLT